MVVHIQNFTPYCIFGKILETVERTFFQPRLIRYSNYMEEYLLT